MSINVKKYTKDQMAKMVEDAQAEVQELRRVNATLTEQISQMNGEAITRENVVANLKADADALRNKLADTEAALERANAEITYSVTEKNELNAKIKQLDGEREDWAQRSVWQFNHPWRNLWAWIKRKMVRHD